MSQVMPRLSVLTEEQIAQAHAYALQILAQTGIRVGSPQARALLARGGCVTADDGRVRIPAELVAWALAATPSHVSVFDRTAAPAFTLGSYPDASTRFGIGVTNLYYQDPLTDEVAPFLREHMARGVRLGDALSGFDVISTLGILHDLPSDVADLYATLEMVANTTKPLVLLISEDAAFVPALDLVEALCGDLAARPFVLPYFNPDTPLTINAGTCDRMAAAIGRGLPIIFSNYGMAGATTPITPAGTLALLTAELLAGLTLAQVMREGAPVILGSLPASFDMRAMMSYYGPETMLLNLACAEMMAHYNLPHCGTSGSDAGWGPDLLAADGFWLNHLTACLGRVGLAPFVGGNFASLAFSPAAAVHADQIIRQARRFAAGFSLDGAAAGLDEIDAVGPGGSFLGAGLTLQNFRRLAYASPIFPRLSLDAWQRRGQPRAEELLRKYTVELMAQHRPPADHDELVAQGEAWIELASSFTPPPPHPRPQKSPSR